MAYFSNATHCYDVALLSGRTIAVRADELEATAPTAAAQGEGVDFDPYLMKGSRLELLEEFYEFMVNMDAIYELKNELEAAGEMESWGLLSALEYSLRKTQQAAQPADGEG